MRVELDERYQVEAYEAIKNGIKEKGSAGIVLPTGTGKTYLALKLIEDNLDKQQILYVSSSPTINVEVRKVIQSIYSPEMADTILSKVKFTTYSGLYRRYSTHKEDMQEYNSDIIIFDEIHRSGAEKWKEAVNYLIGENKQANILGMTATPLRNDGNNMIEARCGKIDYELKVSEAVARGILKLPTYISARHIFAEDMESMQEKITAVQDEKTREDLQKKLNKIRKQVENAKGLKEIYNKYLQREGRYLIFCNPGDDIEELQEKAKLDGVFNDINKEQTYLRAESSRTDTENKMALRDFCRKSGNDLRLLYSKNMLNEGIHNEDITGEIMLRPTRSYILFSQQLGRVLRRDNEKNVIVLDLVGNIRYFKEFRLEIQQTIERGLSRGKTIYNPKILESFRILEEQEDFIESFEQIEKQLDSMSTVSRFINKLKELQSFGIDVTKITQRDTIETLAKKCGVAVEILQEAGFKLNYKIGDAKFNVASAYRGTGVYIPPTTEELQQLKELGVNLEYKRSQEEREKPATQVFIDKLSKLKALGVDVTKLTTTDTIKTLAEKSGFTVDVVKKAGFDLDYKIGKVQSGIVSAYRGKGSNKPPTIEELQQLKELGVNLNYKKSQEEREKPATQVFIDKLSKLEALGVDITRITQRDTIETLAKKSGITVDVVQKAGFDLGYRIGTAQFNIASAYRGTGVYKPPTKEELQQLQKLGIDLNYKKSQEEREKSSAQMFIDKLSKLQTLGVDVTKLTTTDTIATLAEKSGVTVDVVQKAGFDLGYKIGKIQSNITSTYRGKGNCKPLTKEQVKQLQELGIDLDYKKSQEEREKSSTQIFIDRLSKLQTLGVDVTKLTTIDTIETLAKKSEIAIEILQKAGFDLNYKIGTIKKKLASAYRGTGDYKLPTKEEVQQLQELGISLERKIKTGQEIGQATFDVSIEKCDEAQNAISNLLERQEKNKEQK